MNAKTMEGLVGAGTNRELLNTPMRVYREAKQRGDTSAMDRAMGYAGKFMERAEAYKEITVEGMEEEAREAKKKAEEERQEAIRMRREEQEKLAETTDKSRDIGIKADIVEISEEGRMLLKDSADLEHLVSGEKMTDTVKEPVTYKKTREIVHMEQAGAGLVSI